MLDLRVYRTAFVPLLLALFVVAFSLERRASPETTPLAADAFQGPRAFTSLEELGGSFPERAPGSAGDSGLAARVTEGLRGAGFQVSRRVEEGRPAGGTEDSETVIGVRPGVSSRRIVVVADRASRHVPGLAELSGTAALLELSRIFRTTEERPEPGAAGLDRAIGRDLRRTLVLVSTSGASLGDGSPGARAIAAAAGSPSGVDAVLVLGDVAGGRVAKPWVVPWSNGNAQPPLGLRRTVESSVRAEVGSGAGGPRAVAQWARRAVPLTVSAQGGPAAEGLPAVLLSVSGERGPGPRTEVTADRLAEFGRSALRAISAIDEIGAPAAGSERRAPPGGGPAAFRGETGGIVTVRRVLPDWAVRLLIGSALFPAIVAALDGFFRARRRKLPMRRWLAWAAAGALPFLLAWGWLRVLTLVGALGAPAAPVLPDAVAVGAGTTAALLSVLLVLVASWFGVRRGLLGGGQERSDPATGGAAAALGLLLAAVAGIVWIANPYAAGLLVPATHLWLLVVMPGTRLPRTLGALGLLAGLLPAAFVVLYYGLALDLGPVDLGWLGVLVVAGGHVSIAAAVAGAVLLGCFAATARILLAGWRVERTDGGPGRGPDLPRTRGPMSYAGPGSLGGTESALRR